jgi:hypothetical protein
MWKDVLEAIQRVLILTHEVEAQGKDIKELQREVTRLADMVRELAAGQQQCSQHEEYERQKLEQELRHQIEREVEARRAIEQMLQVVIDNFEQRFQRLATELKSVSESERHEREKQQLLEEIRQLRRALPPSKLPSTRPPGERR